MSAKYYRYGNQDRLIYKVESCKKPHFKSKEYHNHNTVIYSKLLPKILTRTPKHHKTSKAHSPWPESPPTLYTDMTTPKTMPSVPSVRSLTASAISFTGGPLCTINVPPLTSSLIEKRMVHIRHCKPRTATSKAQDSIKL